MLTILSLLIIASCIVFRFINLNWSKGYNLHPDEYGLTNTISQLRFPGSFREYFDTGSSPISPYPNYDLDGNKVKEGADNAYRWGQLPIILIRFLSEMLDKTDYNSIRLNGRLLSALSDSIVIVLVYGIAKKITNTKISLISAALYAMCSLPIQQSHFMTVDSFSTLFATATVYSLSIYLSSGKISNPKDNLDLLGSRSWLGLVMTGAFFAASLASKVNLLLLLPIIGLVVIIKTSIIKRQCHDSKYPFYVFLFSLLVFSFTTLFFFRLFQPMSFRVNNGVTTIVNFHVNPDWIQNMRQAVSDNSGAIYSPPAEQWVGRTPVLYPLMNMLLWGLGLPITLLMLTSIFSLKIYYKRVKFTSLFFVLLSWVLLYFGFMSTRWVASMRYFLPIYPEICILVALQFDVSPTESSVEVTNLTISKKPKSLWFYRFLSISRICLLFISWVWVYGFVYSVYFEENTRVEANEWIYSNIPGPISLHVTSGKAEPKLIPLPLPDGTQLNPNMDLFINFMLDDDQTLIQIDIPKVGITIADFDSGHADLKISFNITNETTSIYSGVLDPVYKDNGSISMTSEVKPFILQKDTPYTLSLKLTTQNPITIYRQFIAVEEWDENLPMPGELGNGFGDFYSGIQMHNRWPDNPSKLEMYKDVINKADYVILSSQRAIWSICRIPEIYPLSIKFYSDLFNGRLGFTELQVFQRTRNYVFFNLSDLTGEISAPSKTMTLPVFNFNTFASEEAFSVYDHPPVWIFRKEESGNTAIVFSEMENINLENIKVPPLKDIIVEPFYVE